MGRLVWVGVGAFGGIYTYRKGERAVQALQAQESLRVVRVVAAAGRRAKNPSMALHPASGRPTAPAVPTGLRVGRFRITRTDEAALAPAPVQVPIAAAHARARLDSAPRQAGDVVDISEAARRGRRRAR